MTNLFGVRAEFGTYTRQFVDGGYLAIGWTPITDLPVLRFRDELQPLYSISRLRTFRSAGSRTSEQPTRILAFSRPANLHSAAGQT